MLKHIQFIVISINPIPYQYHVLFKLLYWFQGFNCSYVNDHVECVITNQHHMSSPWSNLQSSAISVLDLRTVLHLFWRSLFLLFQLEYIVSQTFNAVDNAYDPDKQGYLILNEFDSHLVTLNYFLVRCFNHDHG